MPNLITLRPILQVRLSTWKDAEKFITTLLKSIKITLRLPQPGEPNDPADFKVKSPVDVKEIRDYMSQMIFKIENPVWQRIVRKLYTKYDKEFLLLSSCQD